MRRRTWTLLLSACLVAGRAAAQDAPPESAPAPPPVSYPSLKIGGFSDIDFFATDRKAADPKSGFFEGQFTLHFTSMLAKRVSVFGELTATARSNAFNVAVERAIVRWDGSDAFKLSFGRYHTPINYWNTAFHHGQWLQTTVSRPEMTKFGGDFIPVHFVGGLVEGGIAAGGVNVHYAVGLGNGRANDIHSAGDSGDSNNFRAWLVNVYVRPDAIYSLQAGGAYYRDKITLPDARNFDENLYSGYVVWLKETPELIAEYAHIDHKEIAKGVSYQNDAWYVQAAYRLPGSLDQLKPYARFEKIDTDQKDAVLAAVPDFRSALVGIRFDAFDFAAVKVEFRRQRTGNESLSNAIFGQVAYAF